MVLQRMSAGDNGCLDPNASVATVWVGAGEPESVCGTEGHSADKEHKHPHSETTQQQIYNPVVGNVNESRM